MVGQTSNAQASVSNVRLRTDNLGSILGSFFIPNPNDITTPKFETGKKVFRLTTSSINSNIAGNVTSDVSGTFESSGTVNTMQGTIISEKNVHTDVITRVESESLGSDSRTTLVNSVTIHNQPPIEDTITVIGSPNVEVD